MPVNDTFYDEFSDSDEDEYRGDTLENVDWFDMAIDLNTTLINYTDDYCLTLFEYMTPDMMYIFLSQIISNHD